MGVTDLRVDADRSWFAVVAPFTGGAGAGNDALPVGWAATEVPLKDLVPAAAVLINGDPGSGTVYRWLTATDAAWACSRVDDCPVDAGLPQVFTSRSGAGVVVLPLRPSGPDSAMPASWVHLARRAARVGRPGAARGVQATSGIDVVGADGAPTTLRSHLARIIESAGVSGADLDDRALSFTALFVDARDLDADAAGDLLARHLLRHVELSDAVRTDPVLDHESIIRPQIGTRMYASLRSAGLVGVDLPTDDRYYAETLPSETRSQYLLALLIVIVQRTALLDLAARTATAWHGTADERLRRLDALRREQVELAAGGVYTQVMESTSQDRWHQLLIRMYRLVEYQAEVMQNLASLHDSVVAEASQRLDRRVTAFGVLIGIPSLVFGFFGLSISRVTSPGGISVGAAIAIGAAATGLGVVAWMALAARFRRR